MANHGDRKSEEAKRPADPANDLSKAQEENTGGTNTVRVNGGALAVARLLPFSVASASDRLMANLHGTLRAGRDVRSHSPAISSPSVSKIDGKGGALFEWQGRLLVWCGLVLGFCSIAAASRFRSRA